MDRMFCYCWWEKDQPNECKFGERFVFDGQDPETEVRSRIKDSVGVRKDKIRDGSIILEAFWDVSILAAKVGRNRKSAKMDDYIRPDIGHRKYSTGELHTISAEKLVARVNKYLSSKGQPLPLVGLSQNQFDAAENVISAFIEGKKTIIAELCARFGKTIWAGATVIETEVPLTIIATYVKTSFTSFEKELTSFEQFKDLVVVDSEEPDWKTVITNSLVGKKQVVVFLSMCNGSNRQPRIDYLFGIQEKKLLIVDEADFGVHQKKQSEPLIKARKENDLVILMTGTNADKATGFWKIDHYLSVTYPELILEKRKNA